MMAYVSPSQLKNCFYNVYGESIQSYIRGYKMRSAANCLQHKNRTVSEIARAFGYENSSKFSGAFRNAMGMSPTEFRRKNENAGLLDRHVNFLE